MSYQPEELVPLHSLEAEMSTLGSMLLSSRVAGEIMEIIGEDDFYRPAHKEIYKAMTTLLRRNQPIDMVTMKQALEDRETLPDVGGLEYLIQLAEYVPSPANGLTYARIVLEKSVLRNLADAGRRIVGLVHENDNKAANEKVDDAEKVLFEVGKKQLGKEFVHVSNLATDFFVEVDKVISTGEPIRGIPSGFTELDKILNGFFPGDLVIIGARPAMGKTALVLDLALSAARQKKGNVAVFSLEMTGVQLVKRMITMVSGVSSSVYANPEIPITTYQRLVDACEVLTELPIHIDDSTDVNPVQVRGKARRLAANGGLSMIIIDYLQLMSPTRRTDNRTQEVAEIARGLKNMAKELRVPVLALAQLNRQVESRDDKRPNLSDIRESGSIEAEADVVMFLHREKYFEARKNKEANAPPPDPETVEQAEIIVAKHRNGPTDTAILGFQPAYMRYRNLYLGGEDF